MLLVYALLCTGLLIYYTFINVPYDILHDTIYDTVYRITYPVVTTMRILFIHNNGRNIIFFFMLFCLLVLVMFFRLETEKLASEPMTDAYPVPDSQSMLQLHFLTSCTHLLLYPVMHNG